MPSIQRDLWPAEIRTTEVLSPDEILEFQAKELARRTNDLLQAKVVRFEGDDRVFLGFEVTATRLGVTHRLFEVWQRAGTEYPVTIHPPVDDIPNFLKRKYMDHHDPHNYPDDDDERTGPYEVENEWVADSPMEFTDKLERVLSSAVVKSTLFSLLAKSQRSPAKPA